MDGVDVEEIEAARLAATTVAGDGVTVRGRWMDRSLLLEMEVPVAGDARVGEAVRVGQQVETIVFAAVPTVRQVTWRLCSPQPRQL
jgi:hypothetical protein